MSFLASAAKTSSRPRVVIARLPPPTEPDDLVGRTQRENFRKAVRASAKLAFGSDAGVYPPGDNGRQFAKMVEWVMTPMQALRAATVDAANCWAGATASVRSSRDATPTSSPSTAIRSPTSGRWRR